MADNKKTKKIVDLYRTLLDPMGYTVVLKETGKEAAEWEPENKEAYLTKGVAKSHEEELYKDGKTPTEEMIEEAKKKDKDAQDKEIISSIELEKKLQDLKKQSDNLKRIIGETKQNTVRFMNTQPPNELTNVLYTGAEGRSVSLAVVQVFSSKLDYITKLAGYIVKLKKKKIAQEMLAEMKEKDKNVTGMKLSEGTSGTKLQITIA